MAKDKYRWRFFRAGGVDQVVIDSGADIAHLDELDQKLWLALSCPTRGLEFDGRTLDLIDTDHDGHIRPLEMTAAIGWLRDAFVDLDELFKGEAKVKLSIINGETALGKELLAECHHVLESLGRPDDDSISTDDIADTAKILAATRFNGDGVLPPESVFDEKVAQAVRDIIAAMGGKLDRSGKTGVDQAMVEAFFDQGKTVLAWLDEGDKLSLPGLDRETATAAAQAIAAVKAKVDDYFTRCRMAAFDERAPKLLAPADADLTALSPKTLSANTEEIAELPLAKIAAHQALPLRDGANPAWAERLATLADAAVRPVLGESKAELTASEWAALEKAMAPYFAWQATKPASAVCTVAPERLRELLASSFPRDIADLIVQDTEGGDQMQKLEQVEKMILLHRDFVRLLRNFINFSEFYGRRKAIFQAGRLFIDGRSCDLCLPVDDAGKHASLAGLARAYLLYCDCTRKSGEKRSIVAAVTGGETDNLMVGRNGVFVDRKGNDWDATVTRIVENPIGIRQAFWSPYKSFIRVVEEQVAKRASAADADARQMVQAQALQTAHADKTKGDEKKPEPKKMDIGTVAAIGVAVGGIATFLSSILAMFFGLGMWMPIGFVGLLLAISGPSMLIAWLKLRQRNVGPILDANGWSVNAMARINVPFGAALTQVAVLPPGSRRELRDPFAEKHRPWKLYFFLLLLATTLLLWYKGSLDRHLPEGIRAYTVLGSLSPAEPLPAPAPLAPAAKPAPTAAPAK